MGIIDRLRAAITPTSRATEMIQSPWSDNSHLGDITLESLYGLVDARPLTRNRAIKIAAVSKARRIIATRIGALPLVAVKGSQELALQPPLLAQPEPGLARSTTITWTADALFFHGRAFWHITERTARRVPGIRAMGARGSCRCQQRRSTRNRVRYAGAPRAIQSDSTPPTRDILTDASDTLRRALELNRSRSSKAEENPVPIVNLKNNGEDLTNEEIDDNDRAFRDEAQTVGSRLHVAWSRSPNVRGTTREPAYRRAENDHSRNRPTHRHPGREARRSHRGHRAHLHEPCQRESTAHRRSSQPVS